MAKLVYNEALHQIFDGAINFGSDSFKIALVGTTYHAIADETKRDSHQYYSDLTDEVTGTGYTAGGAALASVTVTKDTTNNIIKVTCTDPSWTSATISGIYGAVIYKDTGTTTTSTLIAFLDLYADNSNAAIAVTNGTLTLTMPANGFITLAPSSGS